MPELDVSNRQYTCQALRTVTGDLVRPGRYELTQRAVDFCGFKNGVKLLDIGCGTGASVAFLIDQYRLAATGLDPSPYLLSLGLSRRPGLPVYSGKAEKIPFADHSLDAVMSECSFSHFDDQEQAMVEISRVVKNHGWLIISDLHVRDSCPDMPETLFRDLKSVVMDLTAHDFKVVLLEDHSDLLKRLCIELILQYGSLNNFWELDCRHCTQCGLGQVAEEKRLGYYLLIARKVDYLAGGRGKWKPLA